ncbi:MAG TPA: hypothetical protein VGC72_04750 [Candidatus Elarobacter sp.]|jgi:hypothetical protein
MGRAVAFSALVLLAACGGGGGGAVPGGGGGGGSPPVPTAPPPAQASVTFTLLVPRGTSSGPRLPKYVSSATQSIRLRINGGTPFVMNVATGAQGCTTVTQGLQCTVTTTAPVGTATIFAELFGQPGAGGAALSQGTTTATIVAGTNNIALTLNGVVAKVVISLANTAPQQGTPATIPLTVTMLDAAGATIIGDPFSNPVTLTDSDTSGATSISRTAITSPADANGLTVSYNGAAIGAVTIGATASGVTAGNVTTATLTPKSAPPTTGFVDWPTYAFDNHRDGFNPSSGAFTPAAMSGLHLAWQQFYGGDYNTQSQPILATNLANHAGMMFVGGSLGVVYAFDALTGNLVWQRNLGTEQYRCESGDVSQIGIGGSVAYDPASRTIYVAANANTTPNSPATSSIVRLDAASGAQLGSVVIASSALPGELNVTHTSVTLSNSYNLAYAGTSAPCDVSSWRGRVAAVDLNASGSPHTFFTVYNVYGGPNYSGGGVWGWGGVSIDDAGAVYTAVGNADDSPLPGGPLPPFVHSASEQAAYGESIVKLTADLTSVMTSNEPGGRNNNSGDVDFAATPVLFKPLGCSDTLVAAQGKAGELVVYDTRDLDVGPIARFRVAPTTDDISNIANPAWSPATGLLYVNVTSGTGGSINPPGIIALRPSGCNFATTFSMAWHTAFGPDARTGANGPARSAPTVTAGGVLLAGTGCTTDGNGGCLASYGATFNGALWALNASTGVMLNNGKPLLITSDHIRAAPVVDGQWVFVQDDAAGLYGLTIDPNVRAIAGLHPLRARHPTWRRRKSR